MDALYLFSVYALDGNRGVDDLISFLMADLESLKEFYPEEEFEKLAPSEKKWISSARYDVLGTKGGFTYILKTNDPEVLKRKIEILESINFNGAEIITIDATMPLDEEIKQIKKIIWDDL